MKTITKNNGDMILCSNEYELELDENSLLDNEKESFLASKTNKKKTKKQNTDNIIEIFIEFGLIDDTKYFLKIENIKGIFHSLSQTIKDSKKILTLEFIANENKSLDCINKFNKISEDQSLNAIKYYIKNDSKHTYKVVVVKLKEFEIKNVFDGNLSFKIVLSE